MKDYKRLTERDEFGNAYIIGVDSGILASALDFDELNKLTFALNKFADLEDKIESGEIDYVADKDKEIVRLTAENESLRVENAKIDEYRCVIADISEQCRELKVENTKLKARLKKAVFGKIIIYPARRNRGSMWRNCNNK